MKKYIVVRLIVLVLVITGVLLSMGAYFMLHSAYNEFHNNAHSQIMQIKEILAKNDETVHKLQEELKSDFLIRAKAAAYMIQYNQDVIHNIEQLEHITALLQIDEIHLFTHEGEIYSGNIPEYYGYTLSSGEQMRFFAPLLSDYSLELAQDVTPNTAESKEMQYVAVWSEDKQHIVQVGIEPLRLLEAMAATELSYIFSRLTHSTNAIFFAIDAANKTIITSTDTKFNNIKLSELGLSHFGSKDAGIGQAVNINGDPGHVLFLQQSDNIYIGYFQNNTSIYSSALVSIAFLVAISLAVAILIIILIYFMLDRVVLRGLFELKRGMELIAGGDLEYKMNVTGLPEFKVLSNNVNFMVKQVVESSRKFSAIFEYINAPIAMYECRSNSVIVTGKLAEILHISNEQLGKEFKCPMAFITFIEKIISSPHPSEEDLYIHFTEKGERFLKIMRYQEGESDWGLILDSTNETIEKNTIKQERDLDFLTGLYGKRAFFEQMETISQQPNLVKKAAILMFDLDNLKYVNDTWGHETGDKFICAAAQILHDCEYEFTLCSRLSGDEFAMVLYGAEDYLQLDQEIEKIKEEFTKAYIITPTNVKHKVSISIGYSFYPEQHQSFQACLKFADKAMYVAKSINKGSAVKYK